MKSIKRFKSFKELKAFESTAETEQVVRKRHLAFEKLIALIRSHVKRRSGIAKS